MFAKIFALFALIAVAFAAPKPEPSPQYVAYSSGLDSFVGAYGAVVPGYSTYGAYPAAVGAAPLAYSAYPGAYYVR